MSATVCDNLNIPFTVVKQTNEKSVKTNKNEQCLEHSQWKESYQNGTSVIEVENIKLVQAPSETLNMRFEISTEKDAHKGASLFWARNGYGNPVCMYLYYYYIELRFLNYLHEFNKNYSYEIICKITADSNQRNDEHLFSYTELRLDGRIKSDKRFLSVGHDGLTSFSGNVYFCIRRRFNETNDTIGNEKVHRVMSTLKNTGCDVVLQAKDGVIPTHKFVLSQNSEVFRTMFSVDMKEKQSGIIDVSDIEKRVVNKMLDYFYTGEIGELGDMTEALFKLAHRYQLRDLCRLCEEYYTFNVKVDNDNIVKILKLTDLYELENLNMCAVNFTKSHEQELIMVSGYREYLIQSINLDNVVAMLLLAEKYDLKDVKMESFDFIKDNYHKVMKNQDFLNLFVSNGQLMRELHVYVHQE